MAYDNYTKKNNNKKKYFCKLSILYSVQCTLRYMKYPGILSVVLGVTNSQHNVYKYIIYVVRCI